MADDTTAQMQQAGSQTESSWLDAVKKAQDEFEKATTDAGTSFYPPNDEQLQWTDINAKLVRLDIAILAVHLVTARVCFIALPKLAQLLLGKVVDKTQEKVKEYLETQLKELPKSSFLIKYANFIVNQFRGSLPQKSLEKTIRAECLGGMKAIRAICLAHKPKKKHTATVYTRHYSPRQRRENGYAG